MLTAAVQLSGAPSGTTQAAVSCPGALGLAEQRRLDAERPPLPIPPLHSFLPASVTFAWFRNRHLDFLKPVRLLGGLDNVAWRKHQLNPSYCNFNGHICPFKCKIGSPTSRLLCFKNVYHIFCYKSVCELCEHFVKMYRIYSEMKGLLTGLI